MSLLRADGINAAPDAYTCPLCLENREDRASLGRDDKPGWASPAYPESVLCHRCIKQASGVLQNDKDFGWRKPDRPSPDTADATDAGVAEQNEQNEMNDASNESGSEQH